MPWWLRYKYLFLFLEGARWLGYTGSVQLHRARRPHELSSGLHIAKKKLLLNCTKMRKSDDYEVKMNWSFDDFFLSRHETKIRCFSANNINFNTNKFHSHINLMGCKRPRRTQAYGRPPAWYPRFNALTINNVMLSPLDFLCVSHTRIKCPPVRKY